MHMKNVEIKKYFILIITNEAPLALAAVSCRSKTETHTHAVGADTRNLYLMTLRTFNEQNKGEKYFKGLSFGIQNPGSTNRIRNTTSADINNNPWDPKSWHNEWHTNKQFVNFEP